MHRRARAAWDYTGAMLAGGRWNPIGTSMLYASQSLSLACIEILVHLDKGQLPRDFVWSTAELPGSPNVLPFQDISDIAACQSAGRLWVNRLEQICLSSALGCDPGRIHHSCLTPTAQIIRPWFGANLGRFDSIPAYSRQSRTFCSQWASSSHKPTVQPPRYHWKSCG